MSKSLGNFYTVRDLLREFPGEAIRLALLQTHYRQPLDFTREGPRRGETPARPRRQASTSRCAPQEGPRRRQGRAGRGWKVVEVLCDDLNTPLALSVLHERLADLNKAEGEEKRAWAQTALLGSANILGLLVDDPRRRLEESIGVAATGELPRFRQCTTQPPKRVDPGPDHRARCRAQETRLCDSRPHPRRPGRCRRPPGRHAARHQLAPRLTEARTGAARPSPHA